MDPRFSGPQQASDRLLTGTFLLACKAQARCKITVAGSCNRTSRCGSSFQHEAQDSSCSAEMVTPQQQTSRLKSQPNQSRQVQSLIKGARPTVKAQQLYLSSSCSRAEMKK